MRALPLALSVALVTTGQLVMPAQASITPSQAEEEPLQPDDGLLQADLSEMQAARDAAMDKFREARGKAREMKREVKQNRIEVADARRIVSQYARAVYMNGPTDLSVLASMIDTDSPGDIVRLADEALRVGSHKDDQFDDASELLSRNEEIKVAAESAEQAAAATLQSIDNQINGLRREMADGLEAWAKHLAGQGAMFTLEQAKLNGEAAASWAKYLSQLANWKVPSISVKDLKRNRLPDKMVVRKGNPGVAYWRHPKSDKWTAVLPERTVASVTYAVSRMGAAYKWRENSEEVMDCAALTDRAWNVPAIPRSKRTDERPLPAGGVIGVAQRTKLLPSNKLSLGDWVFLADKKRGVNHVGIVVRPDLMVASDGTTGAVNTIEIPKNRVWKVGRPALKSPKKKNAVPKPTKKPFQCGSDPRDAVTLPDGKILGNLNSCPPSAVFGEFNMQPAALRGGRCAAAIWPQIPVIGGYRPDALPDHPSGRALDLMLPEGCSTEPKNAKLGDAIAIFFMQNAGKLDVQYIIWNQKIWIAGSEAIPPTEWRGMSSRGSCTANHVDHVHVSFNGFNVAPTPESDPDSDNAVDEDGGKDKPTGKPSKDSDGKNQIDPDAVGDGLGGEKPATSEPAPVNSPSTE